MYVTVVKALKPSAGTADRGSSAYDEWVSRCLGLGQANPIRTTTEDGLLKPLLKQLDLANTTQSPIRVARPADQPTLGSM